MTSSLHRIGTGPCHVEITRLPELGGVELLRGRYGDFQFRRHAHDRVAFAAVLDGVMRYDRPGGSDDIQRGQILAVDAGEVHWGGAKRNTGWRMRSLLIAPSVLEALAREWSGDRHGSHGMPPSPIADVALAQEFLRAHQSFDQPMNALERETRLRVLIERLLGQLGRKRDSTSATRTPMAVRRARDYLHSHFHNPVSLTELARVAKLDKFRLVRNFSLAVGMPPHAYQVHLRVRAAERFLRQGLPTAEVALRCGFADQSHLTRTFRQANGVTPARFRRG